VSTTQGDIENAAPPTLGDIPDGGLLLAVGLPKGVVLALDDREADPTAWVRAGGKNCPLLPAVWALWLVALRPQTESELVAMAAEVGLADGNDAVHSLEDAGLLLRMDPATSGSSLGEVRVIPLAFGAGTAPERRSVYRVTDTQTVVEMDSVSFGLWSEFDGATLVGHAARAVTERLKGEAAAAIDEAAVSARLPPLLVALMRARYVFIDQPITHGPFA